LKDFNKKLNEIINENLTYVTIKKTLNQLQKELKEAQKRFDHNEIKIIEKKIMEFKFMKNLEIKQYLIPAYISIDVNLNDLIKLLYDNYNKLINLYEDICGKIPELVHKNYNNKYIAIINQNLINIYNYTFGIYQHLLNYQSLSLETQKEYNNVITQNINILKQNLLDINQYIHPKLSINNINVLSSSDITFNMLNILFQ
jgi:hypothetical protein